MSWVVGINTQAFWFVRRARSWINFADFFSFFYFILYGKGIYYMYENKSVCSQKTKCFLDASHGEWKKKKLEAIFSNQILSGGFLTMFQESWMFCKHWRRKKSRDYYKILLLSIELKVKSFFFSLSLLCGCKIYIYIHENDF